MAIAAVVLALVVSGHAEIYEDPRKHGLAWFVLSLPLLMVWHKSAPAAVRQLCEAIAEAAGRAAASA